MKHYFESLAKALLGKPYGQLDTADRKVIHSIAEQTILSENVNDSFTESLSYGEKTAEVIAVFGGSWTFIGVFFVFIFAWIALNGFWMVSEEAFDPFPFILLNLGLSSLAAFQAPIILMSQNRHAAKDRVKQDAAYETNLKLELQIMRLHEKLDALNPAE